MSTVLIKVKRFSGDAAFCEVELPHAAANQAGAVIQIDPSEEPFSLPVYSEGVVQGGPEPVVDLGAAVLAKLSDVAAVKQVLDALVQSADTSPIFVRVFESDTLPWEALHHPKASFLALDPARRWSFARITGSQPAEVRELDLPLRVLAIIAAAEVPGQDELEALIEALDEKGVPFSLHVICAEKALRTHVQGLGRAELTAAFVPSTNSELVEAIGKARPQALHVFAHGKWIDDKPWIEVATLASHDGTAPDQHVWLTAGDLLPLKSELCFAVLNACKGAESADGMSLAYQLVFDGVPAAVGMRDVIKVSDARRFTRAFYRAVGERIASLVPGVDEPFPWGEVVGSAREALVTHFGVPSIVAAKKHAEWTLPVLYVRDAESRVRVRPPVLDENARARLEVQLDLFRAARASSSVEHGTEAPADKLAVLDQLIASLEAQLAGGAAVGPG